MLRPKQTLCVLFRPHTAVVVSLGRPPRLQSKAPSETDSLPLLKNRETGANLHLAHSSKRVSSTTPQRKFVHKSQSCTKRNFWAFAELELYSGVHDISNLGYEELGEGHAANERGLVMLRAVYRSQGDPILPMGQGQGRSCKLQQHTSIRCFISRPQHCEQTD